MMFKKTAMLLAMLLACGLGTARASLPGGATAVPDPFFLQFDEFGNGSYQANGNPTVFNLPGYIVATDPTGGINGPVLQWTLPETVGTGDQVFYEPGTTVVSDVLRFYSTTDASGVTTSFMIFYSDPGDSAPADSGLPTQFNNPQFQDETGAEGNNYIVKDFGYPNDNKYLGQSDIATPEPSTFVIAGVGGFGLLVAARRRRRASA